MNQREMPLLGDVKRNKKETPIAFLKNIKKRQDAVMLSIYLSGMQDQYVAEYLNIDKGNFSRMRSGAASFPANKEHELYELTGYRSGFDWDCYQFNVKAVDIQPEEKIRELEEELARYREAV